LDKVVEGIVLHYASLVESIQAYEHFVLENFLLFGVRCLFGYSELGSSECVCCTTSSGSFSLSGIEIVPRPGTSLLMSEGLVCMVFTIPASCCVVRCLFEDPRRLV